MRRSNDSFVTLEVDLSDLLSEIEPASPVLPPDAPPQDLEAVFERMRTQVSQQHEVANAATLYQRGVDHASHGRMTEAVADLQAAARVPLYRFPAERGELKTAVEWLERAAEAPAPTPQDGFASRDQAGSRRA